MIIKTVDIPYKYGQTIKIIPVFDIHYGAKLCDSKQLETDLGALDYENSYIIGGGDWLDSICVKDRRYRKSADSSDGDAVIDSQIEELYDIFEPFSSHIIGLGSGNHEDAVVERASTNPSKRLASMLNCPFIGYSSLIRIRLNENKARVRTVIIRMHHGWGGGSRTQGADLTKYARDVANWDCDVFMYGHVHRRQSDKVPRLGIAGDKLISKPKILMICGTYLKTFSKTTDPSYSEKEGYPPCDIGFMELEIRPTGDWVKMRVID